MTKLKDKLSASVRMAKASQKTAPKPPARKAVPAKSVAVKPAASKPAAKAPVATVVPRAPAKKSADRKAQGNEVPVRSDALFPVRVWPD